MLRDEEFMPFCTAGMEVQAWSTLEPSTRAQGVGRRKKMKEWMIAKTKQNEYIETTSLRFKFDDAHTLATSDHWPSARS